MIRAILYDFNGVLVDDEPLHFELFREVLGEEGIELTEEAYYAEYLGYDDRDCFREAFAAAGREMEPGLLPRLIARKSAYYQRRIREQGFPFFPGAVELVRASIDAGWMLGVVSGALRGEVLGALDQLGVRDRFKVVVAAEDVQRSKPDPEGYRRGLELLNTEPPLPERILHPHEVLAIEDSPAGLESAAAVGLATLGVAQTYDAEVLEKTGAADRITPSLRETTLDDLRVWFA